MTSWDFKKHLYNIGHLLFCVIVTVIIRTSKTPNSYHSWIPTPRINYYITICKDKKYHICKGFTSCHIRLSSRCAHITSLQCNADKQNRLVMENIHLQRSENRSPPLFSLMLLENGTPGCSECQLFSWEYKVLTVTASTCTKCQSTSVVRKWCNGFMHDMHDRKKGVAHAIYSQLLRWYP